jgi:hypothetical protein
VTFVFLKVQDTPALAANAEAVHCYNRIRVTLFKPAKWNSRTASLRSIKHRISDTFLSTISDPHELYRFLTTPGVEVMNLMFASVSVVGFLEIHGGGASA